MRKLLNTTKKAIENIVAEHPDYSVEQVLVELDERGVTKDYPEKGKHGQVEYETMWQDVQRYMHDELLEKRYSTNPFYL